MRVPAVAAMKILRIIIFEFFLGQLWVIQIAIFALSKSFIHIITDFESNIHAIYENVRELLGVRN